MPTRLPFPTNHPNLIVKNGKIYYSGIEYRYLEDVYSMLGLRSSEIVSLDEAIWESMTLRKKAVSYAPYFGATSITRVGKEVHIRFDDSLVIVEKANVYTPDEHPNRNALEFLSVFS